MLFSWVVGLRNRRVLINAPIKEKRQGGTRRGKSLSFFRGALDSTPLFRPQHENASLPPWPKRFCSKRLEKQSIPPYCSDCGKPRKQASERKIERRAGVGIGDDVTDGHHGHDDDGKAHAP